MSRSVSHVALAVCSALILGGSPLTVVAAASSSDHAASLQVHLPREITVRDSLLRLGQVSVVRGDALLVAKARQISMGRFSVPGQKVVLDRSTILSRFASLGIPSENVRFTGADAVTVRRQQEIIKGQDFVEMCRQFLRGNAATASVYEAMPLTKPKDLALGGEVEDIQLKPQLVRSAARGLVTVKIRVIADGTEIGARDIPFRLKYESRRAVTSSEIAEGVVLSPENVRIEKTLTDRPEPVGWKPPYGLVTTRTLPASVEIRDGMVGAAPSDVVVRRNETVVIRIERPGLLVTAVGTALQEARAGEAIKVRNDDSRRVIACTVNADGTVEPVL